MSGFEDALSNLKAGARVTRTTWNAPGQWVALSPGFTLPPDRVFSPAIREAIEAVGQDGVFRPYIMLRTADGSFVPWQPTISDVLAEDWEIAR